MITAYGVILNKFLTESFCLFVFLHFYLLIIRGSWKEDKNKGRDTDKENYSALTFFDLIIRLCDAHTR